MNQVLQHLNESLAYIVDQVKRSLVQISNGDGGHGAGTLWHSRGLVVTNAHVLTSKTPTVTLPDQRSFPARTLACDPSLDLAALAISGTSLPTIDLGDSRLLRAGELVVALGHPWGIRGAVSAGPVINVGLPAEIAHLDREFVQAGLQLRPGHSGGPMVNCTGQLVGINTLITGPEVGLAVPIHVVKLFLKQALGVA
jgi:serine protease Do